MRKVDPAEAALRTYTIEQSTNRIGHSIVRTLTLGRAVVEALAERGYNLVDVEIADLLHRGKVEVPAEVLAELLGLDEGDKGWVSITDLHVAGCEFPNEEGKWECQPGCPTGDAVRSRRDSGSLDEVRLKMVEDLHRVVHGDTWARPESPSEVWEELLDEVRHEFR